MHVVRFLMTLVGFPGNDAKSSTSLTTTERAQQWLRHRSKRVAKQNAPRSSSENSGQNQFPTIRR